MTVFWGLLTLGVFGADLGFPLGVAVGMCYVLIVVATMLLHDQRHTVWVAIASTILIILGYWPSSADDDLLQSTVLTNRALSVVFVWLAAFVVMKSSRHVKALTRLTESLEQQLRVRREEAEAQDQTALSNVEGIAQVQKTLTDNETRFRQIIEAAPSGMVMIDKEGKITLVNQLLETQFGYARPELLGQPVEILIPERFRSEHPNLRRKFFKTPKARLMGSGRELYGMRKDGSEFPVEIGLNPLEIEAEPFVLASVIDITERKQVEQKLLDRTQALERSNEELEEFAYVASHDLKEPLRGIHNYAGFLLEDYGPLLGEDGQKQCQTIMKLTQRMESLIERLLYFSRLGRTDMSMREVNLDGVVADVLENLTPSIQEARIDVRRPTSLPTLRCDTARISEVFMNLITNAIKYNDKMDKWIEIGWYSQQAFPCQQTAPPSGVFYVRDNGIGIPDKHSSTVFRIFKRLHSREQYGGGTGVGLTIVKKIIERHGGGIWIESQFGEGTTFFFTLESLRKRHDV